MKRASDYRESAWNILRGRYWWAVLAGLIASILGAYGGGHSVSLNNHYDHTRVAQFVQNVTDGRIDAERFNAIMHPFAGVLASIAGLVLVYSIAMFIVGSAVELGYNRFNLSLYQSTSAPKIETLFSRFSYFGNAFSLRLLMFVKTLLWTLLFIIPGIIAAYRYSMAPFILAENPDMSASSAIEESKYLMSDKKWRLFCLQFSFIGWYILASFTAGIGSVFLAPYIKAAYTAFYLDLTDRLPASPYAAPSAPVPPVTPSAPAAPNLQEGESSSKEFI